MLQFVAVGQTAIGALVDPIDTLIERTGLPASEILQDLTLLSLKGVVKRVDGQTFVRAGRKSSS